MKNIGILFVILFFTHLGFYACSDYPIDEDGLLITQDTECYIQSFELLGPDNRSVLYSREEPDTINCIINAVARFGTNLQHVKPYVSLPKDAKIEPAMGSWIDFSQPLEYTVISGNRKIRKTYKITVTLQGE